MFSDSLAERRVVSVHPPRTVRKRQLDLLAVDSDALVKLCSTHMHVEESGSFVAIPSSQPVSRCAVHTIHASTEPFG